MHILNRGILVKELEKYYSVWKLAYIIGKSIKRKPVCIIGMKGVLLFSTQLILHESGYTLWRQKGTNV